MTIKQLYRNLVSSLSDSTDSADVDARTLICHVLDIKHNSFILNMDKDVSLKELETINSYVKRRINGEPIAYILKERGFYECVFKVSSSTLIPRADTEILVENAINDILKVFASKKEISILDLCCGTGCIGISVAKVLSRSFDKVNLTLVDLSKDALDVCLVNTKNLITETNIKLEILNSDLFEKVDGLFDAILTNPPYISTSVIKTLERQVQFEPLMALDGGEDGLKLIKAILKDAPHYLNKDGLLFMEIGYDQGSSCKALFKENGFSDILIIQDYGHCDRLVKGQLK